jgi:hypothetical protein|tara:strand:- start:8 stop:319 length:312 start_codon:yes stop_codon:yes gene_type:complete
MEKTCREAYDIYTQYSKCNPLVRKKVIYVIAVIKQYTIKSQIQFNDLVALSDYMDKALSKEDLTDYEQHIIMKEISLLNSGTWGGGPALVHIITNSITTVSND